VSQPIPLPQKVPDEVLNVKLAPLFEIITP
jgi:hypothetical protein